MNAHARKFSEEGVEEFGAFLDQMPMGKLAPLLEELWAHGRWDMELAGGLDPLELADVAPECIDVTDEPIGFYVFVYMSRLDGRLDKLFRAESREDIQLSFWQEAFARVTKLIEKRKK